MNASKTTTTTTRRLSQACPLFLVRHLCCEMDPSWQPVTGAAQRRRGRRLRAAWRHEQQSIAQALAAYTHHSALRRPTMARAGGWERAVLHGQVPEHPTPPGGAGTEYFSLDVEDVPAAGSRPDRLSAVSGPQERVLRRTVEQIVDCVPVVPLHHTSEPQMVDSVVDVLKILDHSLPGGKAGKATGCPGRSWTTLFLAGRPGRPQGALALYAPCRSALLAS